MGNIVDSQYFIRSFRDSGYVSTASAISELIDNSIEALASEIHIYVDTSESTDIIVIDNGRGMGKAEIRNALRFGGTSRFDSRKLYGRYGLGLPASSISQTKRVDLYSWKTKKIIYRTRLDIDEIVSGRNDDIPFPWTVKKLPIDHKISKSGTCVIWNNCDRISYKRHSRLIRHLKDELGRIYRKLLNRNVLLKLNGENIRPTDPLYLDNNSKVYGAEKYGETLYVKIKPSSKKEFSIAVNFALLPVKEWTKLDNKEKRLLGITNSKGISILRNDREIDNRWVFAGNKRKENYDDWWRCEIIFPAELDELFGIRFNKQGINPTQELIDYLTPHIEKTANILNTKVRKLFQYSRSKESSVILAERSDSLIPPPLHLGPIANKQKNNGNGIVGGYKYIFRTAELDDISLFKTKMNKGLITIILNKNHPYYRCVYSNALDGFRTRNRLRDENFAVELLLISFARALHGHIRQKDILNDLPLAIGKIIRAYLS